MRREGHAARKGGIRNACSALVGKSEGKSPLGRLKHRWKGNIKMDLKKIVWKGTEWINLVDDMDQWQALVNKIMTIWVP
jgi:hypothetical protein